MSEHEKLMSIPDKPRFFALQLIREGWDIDRAVARAVRAYSEDEPKRFRRSVGSRWDAIRRNPESLRKHRLRAKERSRRRRAMEAALRSTK